MFANRDKIQMDVLVCECGGERVVALRASAVDRSSQKRREDSEEAGIGSASDCELAKVGLMQLACTGHTLKLVKATMAWVGECPYLARRTGTRGGRLDVDDARKFKVRLAVGSVS